MKTQTSFTREKRHYLELNSFKLARKLKGSAPMPSLSLSICFFSILLMVLTSCSISGNGNTESLKIAPSNVTPSSKWKIIKLSNNPDYYSLETPLASGALAYFTVIKECGLPGRSSVGSLVRQLFVGINELQIESQQHKTINQVKFLVSTVKGTFDQRTVAIKDFSLRSDDCVVDIVFWGQADQASELLSPNTQLSETVLVDLVGTLIKEI